MATPCYWGIRAQNTDEAFGDMNGFSDSKRGGGVSYKDGRLVLLRKLGLSQAKVPPIASAMSIRQTTCALRATKVN
jgi:hypothetical protein